MTFFFPFRIKDKSYQALAGEGQKADIVKGEGVSSQFLKAGSKFCCYQEEDKDVEIS